jgi:xanthine dehydrogenase YagS FAD-binding subunit
MDGFNRMHAILGVSDSCIASYAGDFAQALIALDAEVELAGPSGSRRIPFANLHRPLGDAPHIETTLEPGELILAFMVPSIPWARRSLFLKIRDRQSYEFALASAAVALDIDEGRIRNARIALGGVSARPWRAREAENKLAGRKLDDSVLSDATDAAFANAKPREHNTFKIQLGKLTLVRALSQAATMEL